MASLGPTATSTWSISSSAPTAPPLPFRYSGMLEEGGRAAAFLEEGEQIRVVRVGDTLDGRYRVTAVSRARIDLAAAISALRQALGLLPEQK